MTKNCGNCAYWRKDISMCPILERETAFLDKCPYHRIEMIKCDKCGAVILNNTDMYYREGKLLCSSCAKATGYCTSCAHGQECLFETDPSPLPKYIIQTQQQGPMVVQTQIRNPERERQLCAEKCKCWDAEFGCLKSNSTCGNWEE